MEISSHPIITEDTYTMGTRGCCQHCDEPLPHSRDSPNKEGAIGINRVFQNALQALILQISLILKTALQCRHVVIIMVILTQVDCKVQVPINCMNASVITSRNYPSAYPELENLVWSVTAPEGKMILLTFNNFSLGSSGDVTIIDTVDVREVQRYRGGENTFPPFLFKRNSLLLRFISNGNPTGKGFNISASCYDMSGTRAGRLVGGKTPAEGFLELQAESGGEWMRVCAEHSADRLAEVVCGELGFPGAKEVSNEDLGCSGANRDCIRAPSCGNYAYRSQDCSASSEKCASSLAVKVKCFEPGFKGCFDLGNIQPQDGSSYESTSECITSCRADTSQAIAIINGNKCLCSTSDDVGLSSFSKIEARSCAPHQLVYNATVGFCNQMDGVMNGSWDSDITWFGSIVHLTCDAGYSLNEIGTLQCITEVPSYLNVWNSSIPRCEMVKDIDTSTSLSIKRDSAHIPTSSIVTAILFSILSVLLSGHAGGEINKQHAAPSTTRPILPELFHNHPLTNPYQTYHLKIPACYPNASERQHLFHITSVT